MTSPAHGAAARDERAHPSARRLTRRRLLAGSLGALGVVVVGGAVGLELVDHGVLPGKSILDELDGACDVAAVPFDVPTVATDQLVSGTFYSRARRRTVGYRVGYPPGHSRGDELPLVVMLHGEGGDHLTALGPTTPAEAVSLRVDGAPLPPMALVTVDGGRGYWHPHPGDDPMGMVVDELLPLLRGWGLGRRPGAVGTMGISMGGYGALLFAEVHPERFGVVAAISPAIWTSYGQAEAVNPQAYDTAAQFARYDAVTHASALATTWVRVASGDADPFHPGVVAFADALSHGPRHTVVFTGGCHTAPFFHMEEPASLLYLGRHLTGASSG